MHGDTSLTPLVSLVDTAGCGLCTGVLHLDFKTHFKCPLKMELMINQSLNAIVSDRG